MVSISGDDLMQRVGTVDFGGIQKEVSLAFVPDADVGDYVLVHVGFALNTIDEGEADRVFRYLEELGASDEFEDGGPFGEIL